MSILVGVLPSITARKPIAARTKVAKAFEAYYRAGGVKQASALAQKRYQVEVDHGVPLEDIARYEVGGSIAVLVNTAPAAFWTLLLLHSHPGLLDDIRKEIDACIETTTETTTATTTTAVKILDVTTLKQNCPLLLSAYQEVLRHRSMGTSVREVMEDTYLDGRDGGRWLLKKGAMVQMPSRVVHQDAALWGPDAADFDPRRFLAPDDEKKKKRGGSSKDRPARRDNNGCFRAFGGGKTLCPGRHFATNEVLAVVALFVARLDMRPAGGASSSSSWTLPSTSKTNVAAVVMQPDHDVEVEIARRAGGPAGSAEGGGAVRWVARLDGSDKIFAMVTEDLE